MTELFRLANDDVGEAGLKPVFFRAISTIPTVLPVPHF